MKLNVVEELERKCLITGTNLTQVCIEGGIDRSLFVKWKQKEPKTLQILDNVEAVIIRIAKRNKKYDIYKGKFSKQR